MLYGLSVEKHAHWQFRILSRSTRIPVRSHADPDADGDKPDRPRGSSPS
jgi:hypothetical protein